MTDNTTRVPVFSSASITQGADCGNAAVSEDNFTRVSGWHTVVLNSTDIRKAKWMAYFFNLVTICIKREIFYKKYLTITNKNTNQRYNQIK